MNPRPPVLAAALSFILPGLGELWNGDRAKGIAIACVAVGIWFWMAMATIGPAYFRSWFTQILLGITYPLVLIPSVRDAYRGASDAAHGATTAGRTWYVITMILVTGAVAVPLVWQSPRLSRTGKIVWSTIGILNTLLALLLIAVLGPLTEQLLNVLLQTPPP